MEHKFEYLNRDISWLHFNYRVLEEAKDKSLPVYERIKFLAIYSNNLEEFYRVRVSYYRNLLRELPVEHPRFQAIRPDEIIQQINDLASSFQIEFGQIFRHDILPELRENHIFLHRKGDPISHVHDAYIRRFFAQNILPSLEPMLLVGKRIKPFLKTGQVYIVLKLHRKNIAKWLQKPIYGMIKIPTDYDISRFVELPEMNNNYHVMFLEDLIIRNISTMYPGYNLVESFNIKVTRNADLEYDDYIGDDLIEVIEHIDNTREVGPPNRFQYDSQMPNQLLKFLQNIFDFSNEDLVKGGSIHNFRDFFSFPNPLSPRLENEKLSPLRVSELDANDSMLSAVRKHDYLLHFPYQSYSYFIRFLNDAATDPNVVSIKATQYRVASNSAVVDALINAAENGKKVTVFVELKARFDEEANLSYAREMKLAGIKIIYSIPGLKVHAKVALVKSINTSGLTQRSAFISTGNFNEKTARQYVDHGLFTSNEAITGDINTLFEYLEDQTVKPKFKEILVPNFNLIEKFDEHINAEISHVKKGHDGYILLKMNALEDYEMINKLYEASLAGVKIDIIVRGSCCLKPNQPYSKNIRLVRIIDRFLEHDRICYFYNNGKDHLYMGSADWMRRNLYKRIECVVPIYNKKLKLEMLDMLNLQLADNTKATEIAEDMTNRKILRKGLPIRSQHAIYNYLNEKEEAIKGEDE